MLRSTIPRFIEAFLGYCELFVVDANFMPAIVKPWTKRKKGQSYQTHDISGLRREAYPGQLLVAGVYRNFHIRS